MIKYKNFKFIIDVTYGALKFKKKYIYYISRTKKNISIFAWRKIGEGSLLLSSKPKSQIKWNCERKNTYAYGDSLKLSTSFLCLF